MPHPRLLLCIGLAVAGLVWTGPAAAQPTNEAVFEQLAVACLGDLPADEAMWLLPPERLPFVRPALTRYWTEAGRRVFLPDAGTAPAADDGRLRLRYAVDDATVAYTRAGRGRLNRVVALSLRYSLIAADGRVLDEARCHRTFTDTLRTADLPTVESTTYTEAQGALPEAGRWRRWLEPALLAGTLGVLAYLFFAVRSDG